MRTLWFVVCLPTLTEILTLLQRSPKSQDDFQRAYWKALWERRLWWVSRYYPNIAWGGLGPLLNAQSSCSVCRKRRLSRIDASLLKLIDSDSLQGTAMWCGSHQSSCWAPHSPWLLWTRVVTPYIGVICRSTWNTNQHFITAWGYGFCNPFTHIR